MEKEMGEEEEEMFGRKEEERSAMSGKHCEIGGRRCSCGGVFQQLARSPGGVPTRGLRRRPFLIGGRKLTLTSVLCGHNPPHYHNT